MSGFRIQREAAGLGIACLSYEKAVLIPLALRTNPTTLRRNQSVSDARVDESFMEEKVIYHGTVHLGSCGIRIGRDSLLSSCRK